MGKKISGTISLVSLAVAILGIIAWLIFEYDYGIAVAFFSVLIGILSLIAFFICWIWKL